MALIGITMGGFEQTKLKYDPPIIFFIKSSIQAEMALNCLQLYSE